MIRAFVIFLADLSCLLWRGDHARGAFWCRWVTNDLDFDHGFMGCAIDLMRVLQLVVRHTHTRKMATREQFHHPQEWIVFLLYALDYFTEYLTHVSENSVSLGESLQNPSAMAQTDGYALIDLYNATGGHGWRNKNNWDTKTDRMHWYGVNVNARGRVVKLNLQNNNLQGILRSAPRTPLDLSFRRSTAEYFRKH